MQECCLRRHCKRPALSVHVMLQAAMAVTCKQTTVSGWAMHEIIYLGEKVFRKAQANGKA